MPGSIKVVESAATGSKHLKKQSMTAMNVECEDTLNPLGSARDSMRGGSFRGIPHQNSSMTKGDAFKTSGVAHDSDSDDGGEGGLGFPVQPLDAPPATDEL